MYLGSSSSRYIRIHQDTAVHDRIRQDTVQMHPSRTECISFDTAQDASGIAVMKFWEGRSPTRLPVQGEHILRVTNKTSDGADHCRHTHSRRESSDPRVRTDSHRTEAGKVSIWHAQTDWSTGGVSGSATSHKGDAWVPRTRRGNNTPDGVRLGFAGRGRT